MPACLATSCDAEVQVQQAAQPRERRRQGWRGSGTTGRQLRERRRQLRERHRQGRRAAGAEGVAPAAGRGAGCHRGLGRGSGERGGLRAAERRDGRGKEVSISSLPGTEPIRIPPPPCLPSQAPSPRMPPGGRTWAQATGAWWGSRGALRGSWRPPGRCSYSFRRGVGEGEEGSGVAAGRVDGRQAGHRAM